MSLDWASMKNTSGPSVRSSSIMDTVSVNAVFSSSNLRVRGAKLKSLPAKEQKTILHTNTPRKVTFMVVWEGHVCVCVWKGEVKGKGEHFPPGNCNPKRWKEMTEALTSIRQIETCCSEACCRHINWYCSASCKPSEVSLQ